MPDMFNPITDETELARLRIENNPNNEATGHFTGRCSQCGSKDLWTDYLAYGCNCCGAFLNGNDVPRDPDTGLRELRIVPNATTKNCDWCGQPAPDGVFSAKTGFAEGPFLVGDCCGDRASGQLKDEHLGPLLKNK